MPVQCCICKRGMCSDEVMLRAFSAEEAHRVLTSPDGAKGHGVSCSECEVRLGSVMIKAICDPFDYAIRLRTGELFYVEEIRYAGPEWLHLTLKDAEDTKRDHPHLFTTSFGGDRGIQVRLSDIVWAADAPFGS